MWNKPNICRFIMFIVVGIGLLLAGLAGAVWHMTPMPYLLIAGGVFAFGGILFGVIMVRCPSCGHILDLHLTGNADFCPFCGKKLKK